MPTRVVPEADAFTFATLAGMDGISKGEAKTLADSAAFLNALLEAKNTMDNDEIPEEGHYRKVYKYCCFASKIADSIVRKR